MTENDNIILMAVGDVGPNREDPPSIFEFAAPVIGQADIACRAWLQRQERLLLIHHVARADVEQAVFFVRRGDRDAR